MIRIDVMGVSVVAFSQLIFDMGGPQSSVGGAIPEQVDLSYIRMAAKQDTESNLISSVTSWLLLQSPALCFCLGSPGQKTESL